LTPTRARTAWAALVVTLLSAATGCTGYAPWLRDVIAEQPHLAGRHEAPHRVAMLSSGRDAFQYRIEQIRAAERSVRIQTFIFDDAGTTRLLMHELVAAARRGVRVQILADTMFSEANVLYVARSAAAHPNLALKAWNPPTESLASGALGTVGTALTEFGRVNQRMHNKVMVIDGLVGICGGRNYQDSYFDEDHQLNYRDRDVAITGPVVGDMVTSFDAYWSHAAAVDVRELTDVADAMAALPEAERGWPFTTSMLEIDELAQRVGHRVDAADVELPWHRVERVAFWADAPGKPHIDEDTTSVATRLIGAIGSAERDVLIQSPYLVMTDAALELLELVRERSVPIRIHTNSLASTDNWVSYAHALRQRREMIDGLELDIRELQPRPADMRTIVPGYQALKARARAEAAAEGAANATAEEPAGPILSLHAKSFVMDGELAVIGSYNLDPRSEVLNSEVLLAIWDATFAAELQAEIEADCAPRNSWVVAPREQNPVGRVLVELLEQVNAALKNTTTLDLWPFEHTALFRLRPGGSDVSRHAPDFYVHFEEVGPFPEVDDRTKTILVRLARAFTGIIRPLI
jgi:phosphatidylserine/phosphatidylglycerophosphate/cardiolipin synthase-like enzyme